MIGIVTPRTYSRWVRELRKGRRPQRVGRSKIARNLREFVVRLARENPGWGYRRIIGELGKLRLRIGRSSVRRILADEGLMPSPTRCGKAGETPWRLFIRVHLNTLVACDFFTKQVITPLGKRMAFSLAFIHVGSREVFLSPPTYRPNEAWVKQQARNTLVWLEDQGLEARFLIHDRDAKFSGAFRRVFRNEGTRCVQTPLLAPNANAFAETWIGHLKRECLDHFLCFSLGHLRYINREYVHFYNHHRPHQGLDNRILPSAATGPPGEMTIEQIANIGDIRCRRFLGGLLRHYYRAAA